MVDELINTHLSQVTPRVHRCQATQVFSMAQTDSNEPLSPAPAEDAAAEQGEDMDVVGQTSGSLRVDYTYCGLRACAYCDRRVVRIGDELRRVTPIHCWSSNLGFANPNAKS